MATAISMMKALVRRSFVTIDVILLPLSVYVELPRGAACGRLALQSNNRLCGSKFPGWLGARAARQANVRRRP